MVETFLFVFLSRRVCARSFLALLVTGTCYSTVIVVHHNNIKMCARNACVTWCVFVYISKVCDSLVANYLRVYFFFILFASREERIREYRQFSNGAKIDTQTGWYAWYFKPFFVSGQHLLPIMDIISHSRFVCVFFYSAFILLKRSLPMVRWSRCLCTVLPLNFSHFTQFRRLMWKKTT